MPSISVAYETPVNNNEMGVYIERDSEPDLYRDTNEEAQRLIRVSEQVRLSAETVEQADEDAADPSSKEYDKLTTARLARSLGMKTSELTDRLVENGLLRREGEDVKLTDDGKSVGGERRYSKRYGSFVVWPKDLDV